MYAPENTMRFQSTGWRLSKPGQTNKRHVALPSEFVKGLSITHDFRLCNCKKYLIRVIPTKTFYLTYILTFYLVFNSNKHWSDSNNWQKRSSKKLRNATTSGIRSLNVWAVKFRVSRGGSRDGDIGIALVPGSRFNFLQ